MHIEEVYKQEIMKKTDSLGIYKTKWHIYSYLLLFGMTKLQSFEISS